MFLKKWIVKGKQWIKENRVFLLCFLLLFLFLTFPLPYYIYTGGGIIPVQKRIDVEKGTKEEGSFNLAYVSEWRGTLATMLVAQFCSDWEVVKKEEYTLSSDDTEKDIAFRNQISLEEANQNAVTLAYQEAGKKIRVQKKHFYVLYVQDKKKAPLEVGDQILKVNGMEMTSLSMYQNIVQSMAVGDSIRLTIQRNHQEKEVNVKVFLSENTKITGLSIKEIKELETDPPIDIHFKSVESGPSGGLITALAIYNRLTKEDLTKGEKIVGTGTLNEDGTVGEIGGVLYKLRGAVKAKATFFIVPKGKNYEDCKKEVAKRNYSIQLIAVSTFQEAVQKLKEI